MSKAYEFMANDGLNIFEPPIIYVYFEGNYFAYDNTFEDPKYLLHFINKIIHPALTLKTEAALTAFMNSSLAPVETTPFFRKYLKKNDNQNAFLMTD